MNMISKAVDGETLARKCRRGCYLDEIAVGMRASLSRIVTQADIVAFAQVSGDTNPVHLDAEYAAVTSFKGRIAHGMLSAGLISAVLGTRLPGPGCIYVSQSLAFKAPVRPGDRVEAEVKVIAVDPVRRRVTLATTCRVRGTAVIDGEAVLMVPRRPEGVMEG